SRLSISIINLKSFAHDSKLGFLCWGLLWSISLYNNSANFKWCVSNFNLERDVLLLVLCILVLSSLVLSSSRLSTLWFPTLWFSTLWLLSSETDSLITVSQYSIFFVFSSLTGCLLAYPALTNSFHPLRNEDSPSVALRFISSRLTTQSSGSDNR